MGNGINDETTAFSQLKQSTSSFKAILGFAISLCVLGSIIATLAVTYGGDKNNLQNLNTIIVDLKSEIVENRHKDEARDVKLNNIDINVTLLLYQVAELNKNR